MPTMKLANLKHEQEVMYRTGKAGETHHEYGPWKIGKLWIAKRTSDLPVRLRKRTEFWRNGDILTLCVPDWPAEYRASDYCGEGVFMNEEWCLQIQGLE